MNSKTRARRWPKLALFPLFILILSFSSCKKEFQKPQNPGDLKLFGGPGNDTFFDVIQDSSGNLVFCGTDEKENGDHDIFLVKTDAEGNLLDSASIDLGENETAVRIISFQGGYAISGFTFATTNQYHSLFLLIVGNNFEVISSDNRVYNTSGYNDCQVQCMLQSNDGNLIISCQVYPFQSLLKVSPEGNLLKEIRKDLGYTYSMGKNLILPDSNSLRIAYLSNAGQIRMGAYDLDLNELWDTLCSSQKYLFCGGTTLLNGNFYTSFMEYGFPIRIQEISPAGIFLREFTHSDGGIPTAICAGANGNLWFCGSSGGSYPTPQSDAFITSVDTSGNFSPIVMEGGVRGEMVNSMTILANGKKVIVGGTDSFGGDGTDAFIWIK